MAKRFIVTDENVVDYDGERFLVQGGDLSRFKKNPVLLWQHEAYKMPIGIVKDLKIENGQLTGEPEFDLDDKEAAMIAAKYEKGHLRGVSMRSRRIKLTDEPSKMLPGQTKPTVEKWMLMEISLVTLPNNANSVAIKSVLDANEAGINLDEVALKNYAATETAPIPVSTNPPTIMYKEVFKALGLTEGASEIEAVKAVDGFKSTIDQKEATIRELEKKLSDIQEAQKSVQANVLVDAALAANKVTKQEADQFKKLAIVDFDAVKAILDNRQPYQPIREQLNQQATDATKSIERKDWTFSDWQKKDPNGLAKLRENDPDAYKALLPTPKR